MNFANPALLWALPLAAAPVLLHLLSRRRAREVRFSDLSFLRLVHARALPRARLREILLVAARCLLIFCLVLAYAGPVLRSRGAAAAREEGLDLVLWLDCSYSMGYREGGKTRFELARSGAEELIRGLKSFDRVAVGVFSDRVEAPPGKLQWASPKEALETLARARLGFRGTDYGPPLKMSSEFLAAKAARRRAVLFLSDGARHGMRAPPPPLDAEISWLGLSFAKAGGNAYVLSAGPARESSARKPRLAVRVEGLQGASTLDLWMDGRRVSGMAISGSPETSLAFDLPPAKDAADPSWSGSIALRPDALSADDSYFFSFRHPARPRVLCLYGNPAFLKAPSGGYFLKELLGGAKESLLDADCDFIELSRFKEASLSGYKAVILADFLELPAGAAAELDRFVRRGGGLWVLPGGRSAGTGLEALGSSLCAQFGPVVSGEGAGIRPGPGAEPLWKQFELERVAVRAYYLLQPRPGSEVWFRSASGYPLLVLGSRGAGRTAVWAAPLDTEWSNLALKPAFAPWVGAILSKLRPEASGRENRALALGEAVSRSWAPQEAAPAAVRLRSPDGRSTTLWLKGRRVESSPTAEPGLYVMSEEGPVRREVYAVNLDRSAGESDLTPELRPPWKALDAEALPERFRLSVYGEDARGAVLSAAVALLVLELLLALPRAAAAILLVLGLGLAGTARAQQGDRFVWTQLKLGPGWDPYPEASAEIVSLLSTVTSVLSLPERRVLTLKDPELFASPLVVLAGRQAPPALDEAEVRNLRNYLEAGGLLWVEDVSGGPASSFDRWLRRELPKVLPEAELVPLASDNVIFRTFFFLRGAYGRVMARGGLEGVSLAGRTAVVYSRNDLLGVWLKDALGKPLYQCLPGGEAQRRNAEKLSINIIMYALTGNYKSDAVHQPYLLQKMRSGIP